MKKLFLSFAGLIAVGFAPLAIAGPIAECFGTQDVVAGGQSERSQYSVQGARLKLFKMSSNKYRAELFSPREGLKRFNSLERNVVQVGGTVGGYEAIFFEDSTGRVFQFYTPSESSALNRFDATTLAQFPKFGWSEFSLTCVGDLGE